MAATHSTVVPWRVDGPTTLHGYDDDLVYMLVCADTGDPELQRQVALVSAWDLEGEGYARMIAAVPKLLAACQAVVASWKKGDLAQAARLCQDALRSAIPDTDGQQPATEDVHEQMIADLVAKAEAAGLEAEDFDETVHDLANSISADINNAGLEDQLGYLIDEWGGEAVAKEIDRLAEEKANIHHEETNHAATTATHP